MSSSSTTADTDAPAWTRVNSLAFSQAHGGLAPTTLSILNYDALSNKAHDLVGGKPTILLGAAGTGANTAAVKNIAGKASRCLSHHSRKGKAGIFSQYESSS